MSLTFLFGGKVSSQEGQHFEYININIYPREMTKRKLETVKFLLGGFFFFYSYFSRIKSIALIKATIPSKYELF